MNDFTLSSIGAKPNLYCEAIELYEDHKIRRAAAGEPTLLEEGRFGEWGGLVSPLIGNCPALLAVCKDDI